MPATPTPEKDKTVTCTVLIRMSALRLARALPKAELHLHLDGSLSFALMRERAKSRGLVLPAQSAVELHDLLRASGSCQVARQTVLSAMAPEYAAKNHASSNWIRFDFCNQFLQTKEEITLAARQLVVDQYQKDNTRVLEIRFCPALHCTEGIDPDQALQAAIQGYHQGVSDCSPQNNSQVPYIIGGLIVCALRTKSKNHGIEMAELAGQHLGRGVIGFDIAGEEGPYPLVKHEMSIKHALNRGVPVTVHAGEWGNGQKTKANQYLYRQPGHFDTLPNIELAVDLGCQRLGHALTLLHADSKLLEKICKKNVIIECCLTSNVKRIAGYNEHPINKMIQAGVQVTLNTDNRFLNQTTITHELLHAFLDVGLGWAQIRTTILIAAKNSFFWQSHHVPKHDKQQWLVDFETQLDNVFIQHLGKIPS